MTRPYLVSLAVLIFCVANLHAASRKRTLQQLTDLTIRTGIEKPYPDRLADDLGFARNLIRKRIGIDDGKHNVTDVFSVLCKSGPNRLEPVSLLWQESLVDNKGIYHSKSFYSSLSGRLLAVTIGEAHIEASKPVGSEKVVLIDKETNKLFSTQKQKFLMAPLPILKGE